MKTASRQNVACGGTRSSVFLPAIILLSSFMSATALELTSINEGWQFMPDNTSITEQVNLPHTWNGDAYTTRDYHRGTGIYSREIFIPRCAQGKRIYLKFDGAASKSTVSVDGTTAGSHTGAYSSHTVDITQLVSPGNTHTVEVAVNNSDKDIPPYSADFTFMGGLYRDAWMIIQPPIHFNIIDGPETGFKATPRVDRDGTGSIDITAYVINGLQDTHKVKVSAQLLNPSTIIDKNIITSKSTDLKINGGESRNVNLNIGNLADVQLWSPEDPHLYTLKLSLINNGDTIESSECSIGFRSFSFDAENRFLLNGEPYKLRGMCRHQDQMPAGIALSDEQHRRDIKIIKDLGANFIRISHYPQDDAVLEMCDRLGLIVWEEIPVIDYVPDSKAFADNCEIMLREMINRHYNHPSIAMWGYMNEILLRLPEDEKGKAETRTKNLMTHLENVLHEENSSRMSTTAFHGNDIYHSAGLSGITDIEGWNLYQGWYGDTLTGFEDFLSRQHKEHPENRIIVSEYGAGSDLRIHSLDPKAFDFSIEYQQKYLEHYLPVIEDSSFVAGASHWNFIDFSSANRAESMPHINNKGIVTNDRRKKDVYYYFKSAWHDNPGDTVVHIATRDWAERTELIDSTGIVIRPVKVYTNLPSITLIVNGATAGKKDVVNHNAVFDIPLTAGTNILEAVAGDNSGKVLDATTIEVQAIPVKEGMVSPGTCEFAINVGSGCYYRSPSSSLTWLPDKEYSEGNVYGHIGGTPAESQDKILLTDDIPLLQHCLSGLEEYRINVVPGTYEVELQFAELASPSELSAYMLGRNAGSRSSKIADMEISINGKRVETGFSPSTANGVKSAVKKRYFTEVDGKQGISVKFTPSGSGDTLLSAIKIRKL